MQFSSLYTARLDEELGTDDAAILFTTARRKAAINKGLDEFAELTECHLRQSTATLTGGTAEYDLNSTSVITGGDFVRLSKQQVEFHYVDASSNETILAGDDLLRRDLDWLNVYEPGWKLSTVASSVMQLPAVYYERVDGAARYLGFWPTPSTGSSASMKAVIPYVARPTPLTSDTQEPFAVGTGYRLDLRPFHQAAVHFGAHQLEKLRRDDEASDRQLQKFFGYVQRYLQNSRIKNGVSLTFARRYFSKTSSVQDPRT